MRRAVVKSAARALEVLEMFNEQRRPLKLHEIYEHLEYPQSSATHLMKSMVMLGYVNYNPVSRTYVPTGKVKGLGSWMSSSMYGQARYHRLVETLQQRTDETVALSTQNDLFIQYFLIREPKHEFKLPPSEGNMLLLTQSTSGMAILSKMSDRQVDKLCRHINYYEAEDGNRVEIAQVMRELRWIRQVGYCYDEKRLDPRVLSVAFPLEETLHGIPLSIGVGGLTDRISRNISDIVATIRETIKEFREPAEEAIEEDFDFRTAA
jgi:DNA-binding IclR family transcriptional regulator